MKVPAIIALALMSVLSINAFAAEELNKEENTTAVVITQNVEVTEKETTEEPQTEEVAVGTSAEEMEAAQL